MGHSVACLFRSPAEAIVPVEKLQLLDVHPADSLPDMSQKREDLRVGNVALPVRREKAAAVIVGQAHRASTCRVDRISTIGDGVQRESGSLRGRSELGAQVVGL